MTNPKQTSEQASTDARSITEQDINRRVAEALGYVIENRRGIDFYINPNAPKDTEFQRFFSDIPVSSVSTFKPLTDEAQLFRLLMDNWEGITKTLAKWFLVDDKLREFFEHPEFLATKELWILRALVAYKEGEE